MNIKDLSSNWPKTAAIAILTLILFWGYGCPPKTKSLLHPGKKIVRAELQVELDTIIATAEYRMVDLDRQQEFRDLIFKNALVMIESGGINPMGIITLLAGLYGIARGAKDVRDRVKS